VKYFFLFLGILFVLFAIVQLNDPDPFIWFLIYMSTAAICFLAFRNIFFPLGTMLFALLAFIWAIILFPPSISDWWQLEEESKSLQMKMPGIEEARESMGLIICAISLFVIWLRGRKVKKTT